MSAKAHSPKRAKAPPRSRTKLPVASQRELVAHYLKLKRASLGLPPVRVTHSRSAKATAPDSIEANLSPRMRETLDRLLAGDSEKQIAARLARSKNTVHVYVKALYRVYGVNSRGELLAKFVKRSSGPA